MWAERGGKKLRYTVTGMARVPLWFYYEMTATEIMWCMYVFAYVLNRKIKILSTDVDIQLISY